MAEEDYEQQENLETSSKDSGSYFLFLVLILLFMGNGSTFSKYFAEFEDEMAYINRLFYVMDATAESLKAAFATPQKVVEKMSVENN